MDQYLPRRQSQAQRNNVSRLLGGAERLSLVTQTQTDRGKRTVKASVARIARVEAAIDGAEKEIGPIAKADFGVGVAQREPGETTQIGHNNRARTGDEFGGIAVTRYGRSSEIAHIDAGGLVTSLHFLAAEQDRGVHAPVEGEAIFVGVAREGLRPEHDNALYNPTLIFA